MFFLFLAVLASASWALPGPAHGPVQAVVQNSAQRAAQSAARPAALAPCSRPALAGRVECGTIRVPENRANPSARSLSIFFLVARATGAASGDPVFFFTGGPGSAATGAAGGLGREFAAVRQTRDLVFVDQRGTGRSAPLQCALDADPLRRLAPMFDPRAAAACRAALSRSADLRFYTTTDAALDLDDVRRALGYERINLHGSSYGTRAAWAYAARFPQRVRTMTLHGPAPPGFHLPVPFARGLDTAVAGVVRACASDAACAQRFPSLARDVEKAFDRIRAKPAAVTVLDGSRGPGNGRGPDRGRGSDGGALVHGQLTAGELAEAVRYLLYTVGGARRFPSLIARAAAGDYSPLAQASVDNRRRLESQLARGMFYSVTCAEDVPFMTDAAIATASRGTRLGDYRVRQQIAACREWPKGEGRWWSATGAGGPSALQVPALVLVGEFDPATPADWGQRAMTLLPNGRLLVIPHGAHAFDRLGLETCIPEVTAAFIARGSAKGLDASCIATARRPPFDLQ